MDTIFDHLDHEWATLAATGPSTAALRRWATTHPLLRAHADLDALVRHINRRHNPAASDHTLADLITIAADDTLAARTALQAMLPGLKAVAATLIRFEQLDEIAATLTATCWQRIRQYPIRRRPSKIALNLLYDTRHHTIRQLRTELEVADSSAADEVADTTDPRSSFEEVIERLAAGVSNGVLTSAEVRLIAATRLSDVSFRMLARHMGVREETLRQRRLRAERRLRLGAA